MSTGGEQARSGPAFGLFLILIGAVALYFARHIGNTGFSDNDDPGPAAFPVTLGLVLLLGGIVEAAWRIVAGRLAAGSNVAQAPQIDASTFDAAGRAGSANVVLAVAGLVVYLAVLPYLGFTLCSLVLAALLMKKLGARAWLAGLMSIAIVVGIKLMFDKMFKVQLPEGLLEEVFLRIGL